MDGLVSVWRQLLLSPGYGHGGIKSGHVDDGVASWRSRQGHDETENSSLPTPFVMSREDVLLHQLPYLSKIRAHQVSPAGLDKITQFRGLAILHDEMLDDVDDAAADWCTDPVATPSRSPNRPGFRTLSITENKEVMAQAVEQLVLSDDDIED